jgi:adenylate kinase family enzyme
MLTVLDFGDPLPQRPRRVLIAGVSGVGKTTLAKRVSRLLDIPYTEIDALFHGSDWTPRPEFMDDVQALVAGDVWVTEWQYQSARPLLASRADLMVWLDLPYAAVTLPRVLLRTLRRRVRREVLWNGNTEPPLRTFFTDREHVVRWSFSTRKKYRVQVPDLQKSCPELSVVRLRSPRQVERWLAGPLSSAVR